MEKITGSEPAMPIVETQDFVSVATGLTKKEYFAAMAMQGFCASGWFTTKSLQTEAARFEVPVSECMAMAAVDLAGALIAELNK
jgi:hypothetical protein